MKNVIIEDTAGKRLIFAKSNLQSISENPGIKIGVASLKCRIEKLDMVKSILIYNGM